MASKRCSSIKLLSLTFVAKSISKNLLIKILFYLGNMFNVTNVAYIKAKMYIKICKYYFVFYQCTKIRVFPHEYPCTLINSGHEFCKLIQKCTQIRFNKITFKN